MGKTNSLTSHHAEHLSHRADKSVPKEDLKLIKECGSGKKHNSESAQVVKKMHKKKRRQYLKRETNKKIGDDE